MIEGLTDTQITIYNSTVVLVGEEEGLSAARQAIEMLAGGAEHGTVLNFLERDRRRSRLVNRSLDTIEIKDDPEAQAGGFENLVPGLADVSNRRGRRMRAAQVDPSDDEAVETMMDLAEDEQVDWEEE